MPDPVSRTGQAYSGIQSTSVPLKADLLSLGKDCSGQSYCIPTLHGGHSRLRGMTTKQQAAGN